ncbi:DUF1449 family protein [Streptomyces megasporus]|uniref:DUF1449 family protein n=1 Tax=Streptomyces megasporus TaxID=44060 RepID=UPI0004E1616F|nr:DUF1449 family protein [Streptomyces megasporus]
MSEFMRVAMDFPAVLFGFGLLVVLVYWLSVLFGAVGVDVLDGGEDIGADTGAGGPAGVWAAAGLGGVPVTVTLTLLIAIAWFVSLSGTALTESTPARLAVLPVALFAAWGGTRLLIRPLRRLTPRETGTSRHDLVGRTCTIRTGHVSHRFGQAEITTDDGSTVLVQVRALGEDAAGLAAGRTALVFDYDADGEFFRVAPWDPALDPERPAR